MNQTIRSLATGATGALVVGALVLGQPALADQLDKAAPKNSVTSSSIKNGAIKAKDLSGPVAASLAKANTALQGIADNSITNPKLADNAVGSAEVAVDSLTAADLAANSVADAELASDSISGNEVVDGSLDSDDTTANNGVSTNINLGSIAAGACDDFVILSGNASLTGDLIIVTPGSTFPNGLVLEPRPQGAGGSIQVVACNTTNVAIDAPVTDYAWAVFEN